MDLTTLYYFSELAKDLHITRTAERLFISQQTLSNHILRLEEHYDTKLLIRKPVMALTYAGEQLLNFAHSVLREEQDLIDILADIRHEERGVIRLGASSLRINSFLPSVLSDFTHRYPNVELQLTDEQSRQLEQMILRGELDIAVSILDEEGPHITRIPLMTDQIYLCVSEQLLHRYYGNQAEALKQRSMNGADLSDFSLLPFCMYNNRMGETIQKCFQRAGISPKICTTSPYLQIGTSIGLNGLAASFATKISLLNFQEAATKNINIFPLIMESKPVQQDIFLIHYKDRYLPSYMRYFITLTEAYFKKVLELSMERLA